MALAREIKSNLILRSLINGASIKKEKEAIDELIKIISTN